MNQRQKILSRLAQLDSCAVSDALDKTGIRGTVLGIRPVWDCPKVVGTAVTVKIKPVGLERPTQHLCTPAIDAASEGDVLVIDNAGRTDVATWGGLLALAAHMKGIKGVIIDGAARDVDESREIQFPVYARGAVPVTARGKIMQESFNQDIQCGGVAVSPGDYVLADGSGVVIVPAAKAEEIITEAEKIARKEAEMAAEIKKGCSVTDVLESMRYETMNLGEEER